MLTSLISVQINSDRQGVMSIINTGDLVTLKGLGNLKEKHIGIIKRVWPPDQLEIFWLNEKISKRFALANIVKIEKLEVISEARQ